MGHEHQTEHEARPSDGMDPSAGVAPSLAMIPPDERPTVRAPSVPTAELAAAWEESLAARDYTVHPYEVKEEWPL